MCDLHALCKYPHVAALSKLHLHLFHKVQPRWQMPVAFKRSYKHVSSLNGKYVHRMTISKFQGLSGDTS